MLKIKKNWIGIN